MLNGLRRRISSTPSHWIGNCFVLFLLIGVAFTTNAQGAISFVQTNSATPQTAQNPVTVTYTAAQTAGDLNVVVVGWNDSTVTISTVVDSAGNTYALAVGPTVQTGTATQAIYYAKNITASAANANIVTVTFSAAPRFADIRIAEYKGLDPANPVDVTAAAKGTSATSNSGAVTTTNANDLIVGANLVQSTTKAAGSGYTSRGISADGDILEDKTVTTAGSNSATATLDVSQPWIMQLVAFRAAPAGPSITSLSQTSGAIGTSVTITGTAFGASQGTSTVTFNGVSAGTASAWTATSITVNVPATATTGNVVVAVSGVASNGLAFTVAPTISSLSQTSGAIGTQITITGTGFAASQGGSTVSFGGVSAGTASTWTTTSITVNVPAAALTGNVIVSVSSLASNGVAFTVAPNITSLSQNTGGVGTQITITGTDFGSSQTGNSVTFGGTAATTFSSWTSTSIGVTVPAGANTGNVVVTVGALASNGVSFTVVTPPSITSLSAPSGAVGTPLTITGTGFGASQGASTVTFGGVSAGTASAWTATSITVNVPATAVTGNVVVTVSGATSNGVAFTVAPNITSLSQNTGAVGTQITITGTNFGSSQTGNSVTFGGTAATTFASWSATSITVTVPAGANSGNVVVTVGALSSNVVSFTVVTPPNISGLSAPSGAIGTSITITGTNFGSSQGASTVTFGGTTATTFSTWTATSIAVTVPAGAVTGNLVVTVSSVASNSVAFGVTPNITSLSQTSGTIGTSISITGTGFGASQGSSTVTFGGTAATTFSSWTATGIGVTVPVGAGTGNVVVTVGALASNGVNFTVVPPAAISFVQGNSATPQASVSSTTVTYTTAQTAGDLNVVVVGWNDSTATVSSVADSLNNTYTLAVGPTVLTGTATQAIYYAKNIAAAAANTNIVTVTFAAAANHPDIRIAEYSGLDPTNPLDVAAAAQGSSATSNSGAATTTSGSDLLVGANIVQSTTTAPGTGYTSRGITPDGDILEDQVVAITGSYSATATLDIVQPWIMQMAAFRAAAGGGGAPPSITTLSQTAGAIGTPITITGINFGSSQGASTVTFNGISAGTASVWTATSVTVNVPAAATTGNVVVTVSGVASNGVAFTVAPNITSLSQPSGTIGTAITITGTNFGSSQGTSTVTFNGVSAGTASAWGASSITVNVPTAATTGSVVVTVGALSSNGVAFTVAPAISSLSQTSGAIGTQITITGTGFAASQGGSAVTFGGVSAGTASTWTATSITVNVPAAAVTGNVIVSVSSLASNGVAFTVAPNITSLSQNTGGVGTQITVTGTNFGSSQTGNSVTFGGTAATIFSSWTSTSIGVTVPAGANTGNVVITVGALASNGVSFTVVTPPSITSLSAPSGAIGTAVTITGTGFGASQGASTVTFGGVSAGTASAWTATSITVNVPATAVTGNVVVTVSGAASNGVAFTVAPNITSLSQPSGPVGSQITITGTNFGSSQTGNSVTFGGTAATTFASWSATSITVTVPAGANSGNVVVTVGALSSNGVSFTVTLAASITSLSQPSGAIGTSITITGTNFGSSQGASTVTFNGVSAGVASAWSATSITVNVPAAATTGSVVVTVSSLASNGVAFTVAPNITGLSQFSGSVGASITITGTNFGSSQTGNSVTFGGTAATAFSSWTSTSIAVTVPAGANTGNIVVTVGGLASNSVTFTVTAGAITLIQHTSKDAGSTTAAALAFASNNKAGDWIAVVIRAGDSNQVFTVKDSNGNTYHNAAQFNVTLDTPNGDTLAIYYAENIAGGANTITVSDSIGGSTLRFAILEYSGVATASSLDVTKSAQGTSTSPNSGTATTTASGDLLLGAIDTGGSATYTAGSGYTTEERVPAAPNTKLIAEDQIQVAAGTASASASLSASGVWGALLATFKPSGGGGGGTGPTITSLSNTSGAIGTPITITGTNFGTSQGTSTVTFNGVSAGTASAWTASSITVNVPIGATTGNVVVIVGGLASNGVNFTVAPQITSLSQASGMVGTPITITGTNFGTSQGTSTVTFGGISAGAASSWTATSITVNVPAAATTGNVVVAVGGLASNGVSFTVTPNITSLNPASGATGIPVTIAGTGFGTSQGSGTVTFGGALAGTASTWTATSITVNVPAAAITGNVVVTVSGVASNGLTFTVTSAGPSITSLGLSQGPVGATVTIAGANFGTTQGTSTVTFNGTPATSTSWSATSIDVTVPAGATTGNVVVTVGGAASNGLLFTVTPPPNITSIVPISGPVGTVVTINGTNFGPTVGTRVSLVLFNGLSARTNSWSDTQIFVPVPAGATTGNVVVSVGGITSNGVNFTVTNPPSITSLSQISGPVGTPVTITGATFGSSQGTSSVTFNGTVAAVSSWSATSISTTVPPGATTGNVVVTVSGAPSNGVNFTVTSSTSSAMLVQSAGKDGGTTTSSSLAFPSNNSVGNWIAVAIRAGSQSQVFTITDSNHNTYQKAVQLNQTLDAPNGDTLAIYYAENIAGGANTVTVSDTISNTLRFTILEYSGIATANSLDAFVASQGTSTAPNSGSTVTAWGGDLLLGAVLTGGPATFTAGSGYTIEQTVPAEPNAKLLVEDQIQAGAGTTSAAASLGVSDTWAAAVAAFKPAVGTPPAPISVTVSPTSASVGTGSGTQPFTATLQNDTQKLGVTWSLSGSGCSGSSCGTLSNVTTTSVTYTGPPAIPSPAGVTLTATSVADTTKSATASITVVTGSISVTLSPGRSSETLSQKQQFTATVFNDPSNSGVTWMIDGVANGNSQTGTITAGGLFTPGTQAGLHTVTATSVANPSANASVTTAVTDLAGVYTYHNDVGHTGQNLQEYALNTANVNSTTFGPLFSCPVDGYVYAQPLYVANLTVGATTRNVVFIATEHDSVYAFDADSSSCTQLWHVSFLGTGVTTMPYQDTSLGTSYGATDDVYPEIGITSTPVIDPTTNTIYVEAKTKETVGSGCSTGNPCYVHRLHALNITTGAEKFGGPVVISAPNFVSLRHFNRPSLLLNGGTVYVAFGSHGDISPWQGWLMAYNASTLTQQWVWNTTVATSGSNGGSMWGGGAGPVADPSGNIYVETGNGVFDGASNYGDSVVKVSPTGTVADYFTPYDQATMQANDIDMGSAGAMILPPSVGLPNHPLLAAMGKVCILYLLDQTNMGKYHSAGDQDVQEVVPVPPPNTTQLDGGNYGTTAYWNGNIYTTGQNFPLSQFTIANGLISTPQFAVSANTFPPRGSTPAVSANGTTNGIVWVLDLTGWSVGTPAILDAYDATNVSTLLYSSPASGSGAAGFAVKFTVPTVANGKVYVGSQTEFTVFGLLP